MKFYQLSFGVGDPRTYTGLSPTLLFFVNMTSGATLAAPAISETLTGSGLYQFQYGTTQPISFIADGATTSVSSARYVRGLIDPADRADEFGTTLVAIGTTLTGQGFSLNIGLGSTGSTFGGVNTDPIDMFGYVKRIQEFLEGNAAFDKSSGAWSLYSRGSSTLLRSKTLANATTGITKS